MNKAFMFLTIFQKTIWMKNSETLKNHKIKKRMQYLNSIYLAGGLFNAGERLHNLMLERALKNLGYDVILPQREAERFRSDDGYDIKNIALSCLKSCGDSANIYVGGVDGSDADSGTSVEFGIAISNAK